MRSITRHFWPGGLYSLYSLLCYGRACCCAFGRRGRRRREGGFKDRDGLGLGSGGGRALQTGKRFRTAPGDIVLKIGSEKDRLRIFNDMTNDVHIGSWLDTSSASTTSASPRAGSA